MGIACFVDRVAGLTMGLDWGARASEGLDKLRHFRPWKVAMVSPFYWGGAGHGVEKGWRHVAVPQKQGYTWLNKKGAWYPRVKAEVGTVQGAFAAWHSKGLTWGSGGGGCAGNLGLHDWMKAKNGLSQTGSEILSLGRVGVVVLLWGIAPLNCYQGHNTSTNCHMWTLFEPQILQISH